MSLLSDRDHHADLSVVTGWLSGLLDGMTWPIVACLAAVSVCHHVAATIAARAAAGTRLPFLQLMGVQYASAAANRVTPAGLGAAGVTGRFFVKSGKLGTAEAVAAVSTLAVLGGIADVVAFAVLIGVGSALHLAGAGGEVPTLLSRLGGLVSLPSGVAMWSAIAVTAVVLVAAALPAVRTSAVVGRLRRGTRDVRSGAVVIMRHPGRLLCMVSASSSTTLFLAAGFAAAAIVGPTQLPPSHFAALMIGYMVAAAAANSLPTPGGVGTADAALVGVLLAAHAPAAAALATVLAYRIITFWAPAALGLALLPPLRRRGAL